MNRVEFNLLPDLKMDVVKATRTRNTIISLAFLASAASLAIFILLFFTTAIVQKKQLSDASKEIEDINKTLKNVNGIEKILTVQNQLQGLTSLHQNKHASSRLFSYLPQVTPNNVGINGIVVDLSTNIMQISGTANSQHAVNTFIDTLKFTTYDVGEGSSKNAFPTVVESNFAFSVKGVNYSLDVHFDPILFTNNQAAPTLHVPSTTTTRSVIDNPGSLFTGPSGDSNNPGGQQ